MQFKHNGCSRRLRSDSNHQCYCGTTGIGSGREQTRGALSHHSEDRGRWLANFPLGDSTSADNNENNWCLGEFYAE
jgi:hypothetical protein